MFKGPVCRIQWHLAEGEPFWATVETQQSNKVDTVKRPAPPVDMKDSF